MIYHDEIISDSPAIYLPLEDPSGLTAEDASGNGMDGTYSASGVTYHAPGPLLDQVSYGVDLDGVNGRLSISGVPAPTYPFVIESWLRPASDPQPSGDTIIDLWDSILHQGVRLYTSTGGAWYGKLTNILSTGTLAGPAGVGGVQHIVIRFVGDAERSLYVDGALAVTDTTNVSWASGTEPWELSVGSSIANADHWAGSVSRVAYYNNDLAPLRIASHYRAGILAPIYQAVGELLKANADLVSLTGGQIFADQFPDDSSLPGLRFALLTDFQHSRLSGGDHFTAEVQVDAYADRGDENLAWTIAETARDVLRRAVTEQSNFSKIAILGTNRGIPVREEGFSRITTRFRLFGTAA